MHRAVARLLDDDVEGGELGGLFGVVLAEVAAPALLALDSGERDSLGHREQVPYVDRRVPAGVILAVTFDADTRRALVQLPDPDKRFLHLGFGADDADEVVHRFLKVLLHLVGILAL